MFKVRFSPKAVYKHLQIDLRSARIVYDTPFPRLPSAVEQFSKDISESVYAVMGHLPYNSLLEAELSSLEHYWIDWQDLGHFVEFCSALIGLGMYGYMFCFALQIKMRYELLAGEVQELVTQKESLESKQAGSQIRTIFELELKKLHYVRALGIYNSDHEVKRPRHMSGTELATHCWPKVLSAAEMISSVGYMGRHEVVTAQPRF